MTSDGLWRIEGFDTFEGRGSFYSLKGEWPDQAGAHAAARKRLDELEKLQPSITSGGQGPLGIQDQVWIIPPDREKYRFVLPD